jgi:hypothetical protein
MSECWLYKAYHCMEPSDKLLYVGISDTPADRMNQHGRDKWWWHLVNRIEWFKTGSRDDTKRLESKCIIEQKPLFNKHESTLTAGAVLCGCLELADHAFRDCPLCVSACRFNRVNWKIKCLCTVDVAEELDAHCFELQMRCEASHPLLVWTHLVPIYSLNLCGPKIPEAVLAGLWSEAVSNGEVGEDIPELRNPTLAEHFWPVLYEAS